MKETEYILVCNAEKLKIVINTLNDIFISIYDVETQSEHQAIAGKLYELLLKTNKKIAVKP